MPKTSKYVHLAIISLWNILTVGFNILFPSFEGDLVVHIYEISYIALIVYLFASARFITRATVSFLSVYLIAFFVFAGSRPLLGLTDLVSSNYDLYWGGWFSPSNRDVIDLIVFWQLGLSAFFFGYALEYRQVSGYVYKYSQESHEAVKVITWASIIVCMAVLIPVLIERWSVVRNNGYEGLYLGQVDYQFSYARLLDFLGPISIAGAYTLKKRGLLRLLIVIFSLVLIFGAMLGQRAQLFSWVLPIFGLKAIFKGEKLVFRFL